MNSFRAFVQQIISRFIHGLTPTTKKETKKKFQNTYGLRENKNKTHDQRVGFVLSHARDFFRFFYVLYYFIHYLRMVQDKGKGCTLVQQLQIALWLVQSIGRGGKYSSIQKSAMYVTHHASDVSQSVSLLGFSLTEF